MVPIISLKKTCVSSPETCAFTATVTADSTAPITRTCTGILSVRAVATATGVGGMPAPAVFGASDDLQPNAHNTDARANAALGFENNFLSL